MNFIQFCKDNRIPYFTEGKNVSPGWVNVRCPFCGDTSNHLGFNPQYNSFSCWKCGKHERLDTIQALLKTDRYQALIHLKKYDGTTPVYVVKKQRTQVDSIELPGRALTRYHRDYLISRNFDPDYLIQKYNITGTVPGDTFDGKNFENRIIIPIYYNRQLVSFQGRDITGRAMLRYKGCPNDKAIIPNKEILYNLDNCQGTKIIVVEGIFDCWRLGDDCLCTFGTAFTASQVKYLLKFDKIFVLFDPEPAAREKAVELGRMLAGFGKIVHIVTDIDKDPGDMTESEANNLKFNLLSN